MEGVKDYKLINVACQMKKKNYMFRLEMKFHCKYSVMPELGMQNMKTLECIMHSS